jgi:uncharacterized protein YndB with AHSA1/START domain
MSTKLEKPQPAQVSLPSDREVRVVRDFEAPRALVYRAYTTPALMQRWLLGYAGWTMPVCDMDVRVDGRFRWRWRADEDGSEFGFQGRYLEVREPALLRHTEAFDAGDTDHDMGDAEATVTVRFDEREGRTTVTTLIEYASKGDRDAAVATGMTDGMETNYVLLEGILEEEARQG